MRTVVVRARQLSGNRYGGRFTIAAAVGTSRGRRLRFVPERDLGTVEGAGTREEIARFSVSLADEAMRRYRADVALVDVVGDIRRLGAAGRATGRSKGRGRGPAGRAAGETFKKGDKVSFQTYRSDSGHKLTSPRTVDATVVRHRKTDGYVTVEYWSEIAGGEELADIHPQHLTRRT